MGVIKKEGLKKIEAQMKDLSPQEMKELLMITTYKLAIARSQLEALTDILVKHHLTTREEVWKKTEENFEDST